MTRTLIPDVAYEVDGDTVTIEQGWSESTSVVLHKIHLKHLADEMGVTLESALVDDPRIDSHLKTINDLANELYVMLNSVPTYPPGSDATDDVLLAHNLVRKTELALALWGGT